MLLNPLVQEDGWRREGQRCKLKMGSYSIYIFFTVELQNRRCHCREIEPRLVFMRLSLKANGMCLRSSPS